MPVGRWSCYDGGCPLSVDYRLGWVVVGSPRLKTPPTVMAATVVVVPYDFRLALSWDVLTPRVIVRGHFISGAMV